jgi:hypothetical protein
MERLLIALAIVVIAGAIALVVRRRRVVDIPTVPLGEAPTQLDRRTDFPDAAEEWLVVVFSSATCSTCADVVEKAKVLASPAVAVREVEWSAARELHQRYAIDSVPITVLADREGVVRASFLGPVSASELWTRVAAAREAEV